MIQSTVLIVIALVSGCWGQEQTTALPSSAPVFTADMNQHVVSEATLPNTVVYTLQASVEGSADNVRFFIRSTDVFTVNETTGQVVLSQRLDREAVDSIKLVVGASEGGQSTEIPITVIVSDENDNAPTFSQATYDASTNTGAVIVDDFLVTDADLVGDIIEVTCTDNERICNDVSIMSSVSTASLFRGSVLLRQPLTPNGTEESHIFTLTATDGVHVARALVKLDPPPESRSGSNSAPSPGSLVYKGPLMAMVSEGDDVGSLVLTAEVTGGTGVLYELLENAGGLFEIDPVTGEIRTADLVDRENLDPSGVLPVRVKASARSGHSLEQTVSIVVKDVNDEPPRFGQSEYFALIHENLPSNTPLAGLNIVANDRDSDMHAMFDLELVDSSGLFGIEPTSAVGSTNVGIRLTRGPLDYENPNQQKFILLIVARETDTKERLSSTCTVIVTVSDQNDNAPVFDRDLYALQVSEEAANDTVLGTITATDRDSELFGPEGFVYELVASDQHGAGDLFAIDPSTGAVRTLACPTPGRAPCLDYETRPAYFLAVRVTDDQGRGNSALVPLKITLLDTNDNPPRFEQIVFQASVDEGAVKFDPPFRVQAVDDDSVSVLNYTVVDGDPTGMFSVDSRTGEVRLTKPLAVNSSQVASEEFTLTVQATDGSSVATTTLKIAVRDVNNHPPVFQSPAYNVSISELLPSGSNVTRVVAKDADFGENARLTYKIERSAYNKFRIDADTGVVTVSQPLSYEEQSSYTIQVVAVDGGWPPLTGSAALLITVEDRNNHPPRFTPVSQQAQTIETVQLNSVVHSLSAVDIDARPGSLRYSLTEPISAVDKDGREVRTNTMYKNFFAVNPKTGEVYVAEHLDRTAAAVVTLTTIVTDSSADPVQEGRGMITITILDVNEHPPVFGQPWSEQEPFLGLMVAEEQPIGSVVGKITASDPDSPVGRYEIRPASPYFSIDERTGIVTNKQRLDFEASPELNLTVVAHDSGIPPLSSTALVTVTLINVNDASPVFSSKVHEASILENATAGTEVLTVAATDSDAGSFGLITYSLTGENAKYFAIDAGGKITVSDPNGLDRERSPSLTLLVAASDLAPPAIRRTTIVPVEIHLEDVNDNQPKFLINNYRATVAETVPLIPQPPPIVQVTAQDLDAGINAALQYTIIGGNEEGLFRLDAQTGILYPVVSLAGRPREYTLSVEVRDLNGTGTQFDRATVTINVQSVNQHQPKFTVPSVTNATVRVPENAKDDDYLVLVLKADDADPGDNGRVSYHIRVGEKLVQETAEFHLDADSGELRTRLKLDREEAASYELLLVARDQGGPTTSYETLRLLTVVVEDEDDNQPEFPAERRTKVAPYHFRIEENVRPDTAVGQVVAQDPDTGANAKIYYHILEGNEGNWFYVDRTHGFVYNRVPLDREQRHQYDLLVKATNDPQFKANPMNDADREKRQAMDLDPSIAQVHIDVVDINDNPPRFDKDTFYAGVDYSSNSDKLLLQIHASDPDSGINGTLSYFIRSSNLYHMGSNQSSGSVVPSPFHVTTDGRLFTDSLMAEYNQDRFVLEVVAREEAAPFREASANVHLWVYEPNQLSRIVVAKPLERAVAERELFGDELRNATQLLVVIDELRHHVSEDGSLVKNMTDVFVHGVDKMGNYTIVSVPEVLRAIDLHYDVLRSFNDTAIVNVLTASPVPKKALLEPAIIALIALLIVLFVGFFMVIFTCCCIRHWDLVAVPLDNKFAPPIAARERPVGSTRPRPVAATMPVQHHPSSSAEMLNSTDNPLWIDKYVKPYEEQELSMRVTSDTEQSPIRPAGDAQSGNAAAANNPYATIQKPRRALPSIHLGEEVGETSDYATIGAASTPYQPRPRGAAPATFILSGSNNTPHLMMNQNGEPVLVADLI